MIDNYQLSIINIDLIKFIDKVVINLERNYWWNKWMGLERKNGNLRNQF